eukprot:gnl/TRDRNA2_/TRDRNA2_182165_c0_seq1.p1 gnl/TRDRNA2_/TRDRNA2_182165_c0~~gnl/TRDRNA2_/TRDRNA2_182165_c0_seq1.p1  ORF type:complete len:189 (-),score=57.28 gnl/TRDRNA2_/TRDRNA2_182165_c0_seq1:225-791(-)
MASKKKMPVGIDHEPADLQEAYRKHQKLLKACADMPGGYVKRDPGSCLDQYSMTEIDWRVPQLMLCKDPNPKWNSRSSKDPQMLKWKQEEGKRLEEELGNEAKEEQKAVLNGMEAPKPIKHVMGVPFLEAQPNYKREDDIWERKLSLRTLDEALRGNVFEPLPRPVIFAEDYENYREGRYVKDDCPVA